MIYIANPRCDIKVDAIEELLKAIRIVQGPREAQMWRYVVETIKLKAIRESENCYGAGI